MAQIEVYADAMEWNSAQVLREARLGCQLTQPDLPENIGQDLCGLIEKQNI